MTNPQPVTQPSIKPLNRATVARFRGGWALVTGSARAEGLGFAFARQLALEGLNLVLTDVLAEDLEVRAEELRAEFGIDVRTAAADLAQPGPFTAIDTAVQGIEIDLLLCNHMYTPPDTPEMLDMPIEAHHRMLDINARAYTTLMHGFGREMRARGRGAIIVVASGAGLTSAPYTAAYSANKAYQITLGEALWYELRGTGVDVLVVVGGLMRTQGDALSSYPQWMIAEPADVAREVLSKVGLRHLVIPGWTNRAVLLLQTRLSTRRRAVLSIGAFMRKGLNKGAPAAK